MEDVSVPRELFDEMVGAWEYTWENDTRNCPRDYEESVRVLDQLVKEKFVRRCLPPYPGPVETLEVYDEREKDRRSTDKELIKLRRADMLRKALEEMD